MQNYNDSQLFEFLAAHPGAIRRQIMLSKDRKISLLLFFSMLIYVLPVTAADTSGCVSSQSCADGKTPFS